MRDYPAGLLVIVVHSRGRGSLLSFDLVWPGISKSSADLGQTQRQKRLDR